MRVGSPRSERWEGQDKAKTNANLTRPAVEYFTKFYGDTALAGNKPELMCGYAFLGAENILFGSDMGYERPGMLLNLIPETGIGR